MPSYRLTDPKSVHSAEIRPLESRWQAGRARGRGPGPLHAGLTACFHNGRAHRHLFLQQLPEGPHGTVPHKPLLHLPPGQDIVDGQQAHAQVVGHEGPHRRPLLPLMEPPRRVVRRLKKAIGPFQPQIPETAQIPPRASRGQK